MVSDAPSASSHSSELRRRFQGQSVQDAARKIMESIRAVPDSLHILSEIDSVFKEVATGAFTNDLPCLHLVAYSLSDPAVTWEQLDLCRNLLAISQKDLAVAIKQTENTPEMQQRRTSLSQLQHATEMLSELTEFARQKGMLTTIPATLTR